MSEVSTTRGEFMTYTVTLAAGSGTIKTAFTEIYDVVITQNTASPVAESFGWTASGGTITITSTNVSSTAALRCLVRGPL